MRVLSLISGFALVALLGATLVPAASPYQWYLLIASLAVSVVLLVSILADRRPAAQPRRAKAEAAKPAPAPPTASQADAEVVSFLATLQEKGRLIDFLMDDITAYTDAQVGAAARVVHEGCKAVLREHLAIGPIRKEGEGSTITVPIGYRADEDRLIGKISGQAPFSGTLVHPGWRTETVKLPRVVRSGNDGLPTLAPAEVELK
jgi:hypothetical protein